MMMIYNCRYDEFVSVVVVRFRLVSGDEATCFQGDFSNFFAENIFQICKGLRLRWRIVGEVITHPQQKCCTAANRRRSNITIITIPLRIQALLSFSWPLEFHQAMRLLKSNSVQSTSLLVAYWRSLETLHAPNPLIQDPTAQILLDNLLPQETKQKFETSTIRQIGWDMLALRTRVIDDWLLQQGPFENSSSSSADGNNPSESRQLVNLGAGMCGRPYRLDCNPLTRVLEVELDGSLLQVKHQVLAEAGYQPTTDLISVELDLLKDSEKSLATLYENGLEEDTPTDWLAEGLFAYLDSDGHQSVFELAGHRPQSRLAVSLFEDECKDLFLQHGVDLPWSDLVPCQDVIAQAKSVGWELERLVQNDDWKELYGRDTHLPGYNIIFFQWPS